MFETKNELDARVTHGNPVRVIIEDIRGVQNTTVEWDEGYYNGEDFVKLGRNSKCYSDEKEISKIPEIAKLNIADYEGAITKSISAIKEAPIKVLKEGNLTGVN